MKNFFQKDNITIKYSIEPKTSALHTDDQQWAFADWNSRALAVGHSHVAIVLPQDIFATMAAEDTLKDVALPTSYFDNVESTIDWITHT